MTSWERHHKRNEKPLYSSTFSLLLAFLSQLPHWTLDLNRLYTPVIVPNAISKYLVSNWINSYNNFFHMELKSVYLLNWQRGCVLCILVSSIKQHNSFGDVHWGWIIICICVFPLSQWLYLSRQYEVDKKIIDWVNLKILQIIQHTRQKKKWRGEVIFSWIVQLITHIFPRMFHVQAELKIHALFFKSPL